MKTIHNNILALLLLLSCSCSKKDFSRINFLEIKTHSATEVTLISATLSGELTGIKAGALEQHGFVWSKSQEELGFAINDGRVLLGAIETDGIFTSEITGLGKNKVYYVRSFAISEGEELYGETISFMTNDIQLTTDSITYFRDTKAIIHGSFYGLNSNVELNKLGVVWSKTNPNPIINGDSADPFVELGVEEFEDGVFSGTIHDLKDSTLYYYRTFAILNFGNEIIYGETKTWESNLKDVWRQKKSTLGQTYFYKGFAVGDYGYYLFEKRIYRYDPANDLWEARAENSGLRLLHGSYFAIGSNFYVTCGTNESNELTSKKMYKYDTVNDQWTAMPDFPGEPRKYVIGFAIGNTGYMGLGEREDGTKFKDFWKFEEGIGWTELAVTNPDFPGTNHYVAIGGYADGERGYIAGDQNSANFWLYEPQTNTWEARGDLPGGAANGMIGFHINNKLYLGTGSGLGQNSTKVLWRYNHEDDSWLQMTPLPGLARKEAFGFAIGNKGFIGGGLTPSTNGTTTEFWEYKAPSD